MSRVSLQSPARAYTRRDAVARASARRARTRGREEKETTSEGVTSWSNLYAARFGVSICFCTADYFLTRAGGREGPPFHFDEPIVPEARPKRQLDGKFREGKAALRTRSLRHIRERN